MDLSLATLSAQSCVGVVLATGDYPRSNTPLRGLAADVSLGEGCQAFWGGSTLVDGRVNTGGGRVLTVTALGDDLERARSRAYDAVRTLALRLGTNALDLPNGHRGNRRPILAAISRIAKRRRYESHPRQSLNVDDAPLPPRAAGRDAQLIAWDDVLFGYGGPANGSHDENARKPRVPLDHNEVWESPLFGGR